MGKIRASSKAILEQPHSVHGVAVGVLQIDLGMPAVHRPQQPKCSEGHFAQQGGIFCRHDADDGGHRVARGGMRSPASSPTSNVR